MLNKNTYFFEMAFFDGVNINNVVFINHYIPSLSFSLTIT
nr:MAG TPA: hypothetical protein [Caudoviricetes sp.]